MTLDFFKPSIESLQFRKISNSENGITFVLKKNVKFNNTTIIDRDNIMNLDKNKVKIITFITRDLTPVRGYDVFMNSLPELTNLMPDSRLL